MQSLCLLLICSILVQASAFTASGSSRSSCYAPQHPCYCYHDPNSIIVIEQSRRAFSCRKTSQLGSTATTLNDESTIDYYDYETEDINNPLKSAGLSFISASTKSLGMLFYNIGGMDHKEIQALLLKAGTHLVAAGESWSTDWDAVRESMEGASEAFYDISNVFGSANIDESLPLGSLFEDIGRELEDISEISGCCAVGPPCSSPNLLAVEEHLIGVSKILKKNSVAATDEHMMCTLFREVAELFGEMAGRYIVDDEGQIKSEVSL